MKTVIICKESAIQIIQTAIAQLIGIPVNMLTGSEHRLLHRLEDAGLMERWHDEEDEETAHAIADTIEIGD